MVTPEEPEIINAEKFTLKVYPKKQYLEYIIKPDVLIDAPDAREVNKLILEKWPDIKFYVLSVGVEFFTLTREARTLAATPSFSANTKAVAFYTTNISLLMIGKMYLKIDKPAVPTKIFSDKNEAIFWLEQQRKNQGD